MLEKLIGEFFSNSETKPFYITSEFWVFIGAETTTFANWLPTSDPKLRTLVAVIAAAAYKLSRGLSKSGVKPA